jgi:hypothetical protein
MPDLTYKELLQEVELLQAKYAGVEKLMREIVTPAGIGSKKYPIIGDYLAVRSIRFDTDDAPGDLAVGEMAWSGEDKTTSLQTTQNSAISQGKELVQQCVNKTASQIDNGRVVVITDGSGQRGHIEEVIATNDAAKQTVGVATVDFLVNGKGDCTTSGLVRDIPLVGFVEGDKVYLSDSEQGGMQKTQPTGSCHTVYIGTVVFQAGGRGDVLVDIRYLGRGDGSTPVCLTSYSPRPERNAEENIHGGLIPLVTGHDLSAGDLTLTGATSQGIGKIIVVVNAGTDVVGEITVTGTEVNRDTGAEVVSQTSTLTIDALTTDASSTDINGQDIHDLSGAYITDKWFIGTGVGNDIVISSSDTTITDIDVYHCSFEQFNDASVIHIGTFDMNFLCTDATAASVSTRLYTVIVTGDKVTIEPVAGYVSNVFTADRFYRVRRGNLGLTLDGSKDGVFVTTAFLGSPSKFADAGIKVWANVII